jgi:MOSC domain-containing protein YiiM
MAEEQTNRTSPMWRGTVVSLHIAGVAAEAMRSVDEVRAVAGKGLEGDRYFNGTGTWSKTRTAAPVTLIEIETFETLKRDYGITLALGDTRRNIVTRGVPLAHLVGRQFRVGSVVLLGVRLVEPCDHLARLTNRRVLTALIHRGGLRADILAGGVIGVGNAVEPAA